MNHPQKAAPDAGSVQGSDTASDLVRGLAPEDLFAIGMGAQRNGDDAQSLIGPEELALMLPTLEIRRIVGQGGMGTVYEGWQRDLHRPVAVKLLSPELTDTPGLAARFRSEARLMAQLHHPCIVQIYEAGETAEGLLFYVMELIDGEDLATRMSRGRLSLDDSVNILCHVAEALQAAHSLGVVHRDVKPANILLPKEGPPKLGDFGLALTTHQTAESLRLTRVGTTLGTLEYAAPEQLSRTHTASAASDVYSLGVLTYEMLTGELPRGNFDPPSVLNPAVDAAFDSVVLRALQSDPARRYADAGEFRSAFLHAADRRQQQALRDQAVRRRMVRRAWLVAALATVACITGGSAVLAWQARREAEKRRAAAQSAEQRMAGLFQFLLTDLRQRLEPTGNLGAMESVMEKAVEHFRREYEDAGRSPEAAVTLADVLAVKADVIGVRGLKAEADALYTEALHLAEQARSAAPQQADHSLRVFQALTDRAKHRMVSTDYTDALADGRAMLSEAEMLAAQDPGPQATHLLAKAHTAIADALGYTGPFDGAKQEYLEARKLLIELGTKVPEDKTLAAELAYLDTAMGSNAEARGDFPEMLRYFTSWHDYVIVQHGRDSDMYSHAAFRMAVAQKKLGHPELALPYLKDALRLAEQASAELPGHKGRLGHLSWCLRLSAECHEALGNQAEAAPLRRREKEITAEYAAKPRNDSRSTELEFARLSRDPATNRKSWWAFCKSLQRAAEALPSDDAARSFYETWISRSMEAAPASDPGSLVRLVPAFIHNRLAGLILETDPARAAHHAQQALALRDAVAKAHPDDPELSRDVLSSACHVADSTLRGDDVTEAEAIFQKIVTYAQRLSPEGLLLENNGVFYAGRMAELLETAASRWPARAHSFQKTGQDLSAALLDRLPPGTAAEQVKSLRQRLTGLTGGLGK